MDALTRPVAAFLLALLIVTSAAAVPVHDPWLARMQVGEARAPEAIAMDSSGWPVGLFQPLTMDPGWIAGAKNYFQSPVMPRDLDQIAWRLALPSTGSARAAQQRYAVARRHAGLLRNLAVVGAAPLDTPLPGQGPWATDVVMLQASRQWEQQDWQGAGETVDQLLAAPHRRRLDASQRLTWTLRREVLRQRAGQIVDLRAIWNRLEDLGPYDTRSGWALWIALRNARDLAPLDTDQVSTAAAVLMARAGKLFMDGQSLGAIAFAPEVAAGLGGLLLPADQLPAHLAQYSDLPSDGRFQGYWLRGQRRRDNSVANVERLAALPGLKDGHRLDLWRRASEKHLLQTHWPAGLEALENALGLMDSGASRGVRNRLREWTVQSMALALAEERLGDARTVVTMAERHLDDADRRAFRADAAALLQRLEHTDVDPAGDLRPRGEAVVRQGESPDVGSRPPLELPDPAVWRHRLWGVWARWGLALIGDAALSRNDQSYRDGLAFVRDTDDPDQRHTTATALAAGRLHAEGSRDRILAFAWHRELARASLGLAVPQTTPIPRLLEDGPWRSLEQQLRGHAMLGAALALGDDRGMLAVVVRLPSAGLPDRLFRLFWYPVPSDPALHRALAASDLPPELLLAIARNESLFEPAIRSRAGALGYMQIMPFHYDDPAGAPGDHHWSHPATSLQAGARILAGEVRRFENDPYRAVAAYNAGSGAVKRWNEQLGGVADRDLFWAWIGYPETRHYTLRVLRDREVYRWLLQDGP